MISLVLSLIGRPVVDMLNKIEIKKFKFPGALSAAITLIFLWALVFAFFRVFIPLIAYEANQLSTINVQSIIENLDEPLKKAEGFFSKFNLSGDKELSFQDYIAEKMISILNITLLSNIFSSLAALLGNIFIAIFSISFITFFFLKGKTMFADGIILLVPTEYEQNARHVLSSVRKLLMRYFIGIGFQITCIILLIAIGLTIVGVGFKHALVIGLFVGIMNVIPYIGPLIGIVIGILIGIATHLEMDFYTGILPLIVYMTIVFICVQIIDNALFQPLIYGSSVNAHPLEIFLVLLIAGSLAGIVGMILAIPSYIVIRVIAKEFFNKFKVIKKLTEKM